MCVFPSILAKNEGVGKPFFQRPSPRPLPMGEGVLLMPRGRRAVPDAQCDLHAARSCQGGRHAGSHV